MRSTSGNSFWRLAAVGREQVRLMHRRRNEIEQHDADGKRLVPWHALPKVLEACQQKAGIPGFREGDLVPMAAEIADPGQVHA